MISPTARKWTVLAYIAADNNLEQPMVDSILQMERVGSSGQVDIVAQIDRRSLPTEPPEVPPELANDKEFVEEMKKAFEEKMKKLHLNFEGDWSTARRYHVIRGVDDPSQITYKKDAQGDDTFEMAFKTDKFASPVVADLGETDLGNPKNLSDFLEWGMKNYPAEHYLLLFIDHGDAFLGSLQDENPPNLLSLPDIQRAIAEAEEKVGRKLDIIGFNTCLMGTAEVAYQLHSTADILVASEEVENAPGWPLQKIMAALTEGNRQQTMTPLEVAQVIVGESEKTPFEMPTASAIDLKKIEAVKGAVDTLGKDLLDPKISSYFTRKSIRESLHFAQGPTFPEGDHVDIIDMCSHLKENKKVATSLIVADCEELERRVKEAILAEEHGGQGMEQAHGLSLYAPDDGRRYDPFACKNPMSGEYNEEGKFSYRKLGFARDNRWEELLRKKFLK